MGEPQTRTVDSGGISYQVVEQRRRMVNDVVEHAFLQDISAEVWPGAVIQGIPSLRVIQRLFRSGGPPGL